MLPIFISYHPHSPEPLECTAPSPCAPPCLELHHYQCRAPVVSPSSALHRAMSLHCCLSPLSCPEPSPHVPLPSRAAHCRCCRCLRHCPEPALPCRAQCYPLPVSPCPQPCIYLSPDFPLQHEWTTAMVRTREGHRYRLRVRFSTPEIDVAGTSRAADAHSPDLPAET